MFSLIDYEYFDLFTKDMTDKKISIVSDDGLINITNTELHQQQFELTESLCSESELRFGSCEASMVKFTVNNIFLPMNEKWITITMIVEGHTDKPFRIGRYKVFSDIATADRTKRDVVAYDAMYDIIGADVAEWYNTVLPNNDSTVTIKQFRTSFIQHFGLEQEDKTLVNDDMIVKKTIQIVPSGEEDTETGHKSTIGEALSGRDVLASVCEINGCFGHIGRDGKFHWIYLEQDIEGLYPANNLYPSDDLFPANPKSTSIGKNKSYIGCQWENFTTKSINKIQIRQEENDIGKIYPNTPLSDEDNCYIIQGNFLVYGKSSDELNVIAQNIFSKITNIIYRSFNADVTGNPCFEVGDAVRISTKYELVESYILQRTLKGIQTLRDAYSANGTEWYREKVNGVHTSIMQIKGKANILTRTIEETKLEMYDIEAGLNNTITITARGLEGKITAETNRAEGEEQKLSNSIKITAEGIKADLAAEIRRADEKEKWLEEDYNSKIKITADEISAELTKQTQVWDTGKYDITYRGDGEPDIAVTPGKYYLDTQSGAIYYGIAAVYPDEHWLWQGSYDQDTGSVVFRLANYASATISLPRTISVSEVMYTDPDTNPFVGSGSPPEGDHVNVGDVFYEVTDYLGQGRPIPDYATLDYWYYKRDDTNIPAHWELKDYAEKISLDTLSTKITAIAGQVDIKVSKGDVTSQLLIEPTDIYLKTGRLRIETDNLEINKDGTSGEILSRNLSERGVTKETARYIKLNTGGLEGGYADDIKCKIVCNNEGLEFRGKILTFCMNTIKVGEGMNSTSLKTAYTGDIKYAVQQTDGTIKNAVMSVRNGMIMKNE